MSTSTLNEDLEQWFDFGDELAGARARRALEPALGARPRVRRALSPETLDEIRQDVLLRLLDRESGVLKGSINNPLAYARQVWAHACTDVLRKWGPRASREDEVRMHLDVPPPRPDAVAEINLDFEIAVAAMEALTVRQRVSLLLISRPRAIADDDWREALEDRHETLPAVPTAPVERTEAAEHLFGEIDPQDRAAVRRRQTSFDKLVRRALEAVREALAAT